MGDKSETFEFNLKPPVSKQELQLMANKAAAMFYGVAAPAMVVAATLLIAILNTLLIEPSYNGWRSAIDYLQTQLTDQNNYLGGLKLRNGELKVKTDFITEPVSMNVNVNEVFDLIAELFDANTTQSIVTSYQRQATGEFVVNAVSPNPNGPIEILARFLANQKIVQADLMTVTLPEDVTEYNFTIQFSTVNKISATT